MKKKKIIYILIVISAFSLFGNIRYIDFKSFPNFSDYESDILYIINNEFYMDVWEPEWNYDIDKNELTENVLKIFEKLSSEYKSHSKNIDLCLFLGELAHFLYNIDAEGDFFTIANEYYDMAREIESRDYRSDWFQGYHLVQGAKPIEGMQKFLHCETAMPPLEMVPDFWLEYSIGAYQSQMIFHAKMACEYYLQITGEDPPGPIKDVLYDNLLVLDKESHLSKYDIWGTEENKSSTYYISYLFGIKAISPKDYLINPSDFNNGISYFTVKPPEFIGYNNKKIGATFLMLMKTGHNDSIEDFLQGFLKDDYTVEEYEVEINKGNAITLLIEADNLYKDQGGGKMFLTVFEREVPEHSGIFFEEPRDFPININNEPSYYRLGETYERYSGSIYYAFLLDSCESIFDEAFEEYINFLNNNILVE